jgi:uncharacterized protein
MRPSCVRVVAGVVLATAACFAGCKGGSSNPPPTGTGGTTGVAGSGSGAGSGNAGGDGGSPGEDAAVAFTRAELLGAFGVCAANQARAFRDKAQALDAAAAAYAAAPDTATRDAVRQAFKDALDAWQVIDIMQFGPTASSSVIGGKDFRGNIYSWPQVSRCAVEEAIVARTYESASFGTVLFANARGLAALEYLLFYEGADTVCPATSPAVAGWAALSAEDRDARKRAYAAAATRDVTMRATAHDQAWDPAAMNFVQTMRSAGPGNATYETQQKAIETVGIALFYLDMAVKDTKLTTPLNDGCVSAACLESRYGSRSKANIRANLDGLRRILEGCEAGYAGVAFDDLLVSIGAPDLPADLRAKAIAAQAALDAIEEPDLDQALVQDRASVMALRDAIAEITTVLKTTFVNVLGFEPSIIPSDNDT